MLGLLRGFISPRLISDDKTNLTWAIAANKRFVRDAPAYGCVPAAGVKLQLRHATTATISNCNMSRLRYATGRPRGNLAV